MRDSILGTGLLFLFLITSCTSTIGEEERIIKNGLAYKRGDRTPYTGDIVGNYLSGKKRIEMHYKNGMLEGTVTQWYDSGQKWKEKTLKDGNWKTLNEWDMDGNKIFSGK